MQATFEATFAAVVTRRGLLPALVSGQPTRSEKHLLKQAKREAARRTKEERN